MNKSRKAASWIKNHACRLYSPKLPFHQRTCNAECCCDGERHPFSKPRQLSACGLNQIHKIAPGYLVEGWDIELKPVLAIFGANASGKSNVIQALDYLLLLMVNGNQETSRLQKTFRYAFIRYF